MSQISKKNKNKRNGNGNGKVQQALITLSGANNGNAKPKQRKAKLVTNGIRTNYQTTKNNFLLSLVSPFCPEAYGTRVPDPFPFPTVTHHLRQTTVIGAAAGHNNGCAIFLPSPVFSIIDGTGLGGNRGVQATSMAPFGAGGIQQHIYKSTTNVNLNATYGSYRTVSWGIKISNLQTQLAATGRIFIAMIPIGDSVPSEPELQNSADLVGTLKPVFGTDLSVVASSNILQLPSAQQFAVSDLLHGDLEVSGMYTNSSFWQFKTTDTNGVPYTLHRAGDSFQQNTGTGAITASGYKDPNRMPGGCAIVVYFEGLPSGATNSFSVESIYHLEGSPQLSGTSAATPVPSGAEKILVGDTDIVDKAMGLASKLENVFTFITKGADFLNRNTEAMDRLMAVGQAASTVRYLM